MDVESPKGLNIGYVYQDQYPWDIRVEKISEGLIAFGHNINILCRNRQGLPREESVGDKLLISRLRYWPSKILTAISNVPAFFSPFWLRFIYRKTVTNRFDLLIIRDLPLAPTVWIIGKLCKVPVILDMAEDYPAMIADMWKYKGPSASDFVVRNPFFLRIMERFVVGRFDGVLVVSEASKNRLLRQWPSLNGKVSVIQNAPRLESVKTLLNCEVSQMISARRSPKLLYVGGLEESRGLDVAINAMATLIEHHRNATLWIIGDGTAKTSLLEQTVKLGLTNSIFFTGWVDQEYIPGVIDKADICLIPHRVSQHTNTTLPNKIYDYMAQGKAILASNAKSLEHFLHKYECGLSYVDDDPLSLVSSLRQLLKDDIYLTMGRAGAAVVETELNWGIEARKLSDSIWACISREQLDHDR